MATQIEPRQRSCQLLCESSQWLACQRLVAVQNAAAYGARMGAVAQDCRSCAAYSAASSAVSNSLIRNASVQILAPGGSVGDVLRIRVTGEVPNLMGPLMALNGGGLGGPIVVSAEATFRAEGW